MHSIRVGKKLNCGRRSPAVPTQSAPIQSNPIQSNTPPFVDLPDLLRSRKGGSRRDTLTIRSVGRSLTHSVGRSVAVRHAQKAKISLLRGRSLGCFRSVKVSAVLLACLPAAPRRTHARTYQVERGWGGAGKCKFPEPRVGGREERIIIILLMLLMMMFLMMKSFVFYLYLHTTQFPMSSPGKAGSR
jgi:hypothetical protein